MNKQDIAEKVHGVLGTTKADAERAVEAMIAGIVGELKKGGEVSIAGLGIFKTKMRAARAPAPPCRSLPCACRSSRRQRRLRKRSKHKYPLKTKESPPGDFFVYMV